MMTRLSIESLYNGITVNCSFNKKINILRGYSGMGKSLLLSALALYCRMQNIPYLYINYDNLQLKEDEILYLARGKSVLLLDNADLYMTNGLLLELSDLCEFLVLSIKDVSSLDRRDADEYIVEYENQQLGIRSF